jgi:hypothetical protein
MWLILTALAAAAATIVWYVKSPGDKYKLGILSLMLWGATIMWVVDHIMAFASEGGEFFELGTNATMLGVAVIVLALVVWTLTIIITDPKGVLKKIFNK